MALPRFRIIYFPCRGRQETIQLLCELGGLSYETAPVDIGSWKADKEAFVGRSPFGQLPLLLDRESGREHCQSLAIHRYLADLTGALGRTPSERVVIDEACETIGDLETALLGITWDKQQLADLPAHRERCRLKLKQLTNFFNARKLSSSLTRWVSPDYVSLADVRTAVFLEALAPLHASLLQDEFPQLHRFNEEFYTSVPQVAAYVKSSRRFPTWTLPMAAWGGQRSETVQRN